MDARSMNAADDAALVERLNTALEAGAPSAALPSGVAFFRLKPIELARLLALAERGIAERADCVAFICRESPYVLTKLVNDIERGAHEGAAKERAK